MSHFSLKSLTFYGIAIGSVMTLFAVVTAYGEANLKAAVPISGDYAFQVPPLKGCSTATPVNLSIQQSGIYVSAALTNAQTLKKKDKPSAKAMTLNGQWKNQQLKLEGVVPIKVLCPTRQQGSQNSRVQAKLQGSFRQSTFNGKLLLDALGSIQFAAEKQVQSQGEEASH